MSEYKYIRALIQWNSVSKATTSSRSAFAFFFEFSSGKALKFFNFAVYFLFLSFPCTCSETRFSLTIKTIIFNSVVVRFVEF